GECRPMRHGKTIAESSDRARHGSHHVLTREYSPGLSHESPCETTAPCETPDAVRRLADLAPTRSGGGPPDRLLDCGAWPKPTPSTSSRTRIWVWRAPRRNRIGKAGFTTS